MSSDLHSITRARGFRAAGACCGIKPSGKPDLALVASDAPAKIAALFTTNALVGAPVAIGRDVAGAGRARAIVVNAGCANVATGLDGIADARRMCAAAGEALDCDPRLVLPASTGVIGHRLPIDSIVRGIGDLAPRLGRGRQADADAAHAILTTDLRAKAAHRTIRLGSTRVHVGGIAKGSGMIAPDMATMLAFLTTDAAIGVAPLRKALRAAVNAEASFNRISVDTDTSTSDTVAILANGAAGNPPPAAASPDMDRFTQALTQVCCELAYAVIADGEGAEHVIRVTVTGAAGEADALSAARAVADSPLVKTAVHGGDANWGRVAAAVGRSGARMDPARLSIDIGGVSVFRAGEPATFDPAGAAEAMRHPEVPIDIDLGRGRGRCVFLGCDLSRQYVAINADYTT
jgi:glutamate N-acetyltransferase/amino-acid N-acetyltransferase